MKGMKEKKMAVIKTEHLSHVYSEGTPFVKMAIQDVNLSIEEGELVGVIGHTGSGKSTLIQHLNGLLKPTSGKIYIDGQDMWEDLSLIHIFLHKDVTEDPYYSMSGYWKRQQITVSFEL